MKSRFLLFLIASILISACATPKSYSETSEGKKKVKYYQQVQNGLHPKKAPKF